MKNFGLVFKHYFIRTFKHPASLFPMLLLPTVIIILFSYVNDQAASERGFYHIFYGHNIFHTSLTIVNLFFFQLFGSMVATDNLHEMKSNAVRWRLWASPNKKTTFPIAILAASWLVTIFQAIIVFVVCSIVLNIYWGNMFVNVLALVGISLFGQALGVVVFTLTKSAGQAQAILYPVTFFIGGLAGIMIPIREFIDHEIIEFLVRWSPLNLANDAVAFGGRFGSISVLYGTYSGTDMSIVATNILVIFTTTIILAVLGFMLGKAGKQW